MSEGVGTTPGTRIVDGRQVPEVGTWEIDPSHQSFEFIAQKRPDMLEAIVSSVNNKVGWAGSTGRSPTFAKTLNGADCELGR